MLSRLFSIFKNKDDDYIHGRRKCSICGNQVDFQIEKGSSLRESKCPICKGTRRNRDLAKVILMTYVNNDTTFSLSSAMAYLKKFVIYETQAVGPIHSYLSNLPKYICSEFFDNIPLGSLNEDGIRCEDIEDLSFPDNFFDIIITQDVFEHIKNPSKGFTEIKRVLKYDGYHIFTIPFHEGRKSLVRVKKDGSKNIFSMPPVYHLDPLKETGSLVYTDFGKDIIDYLKSLGLPTKIAVHEKFYSIDDIPYIIDEAEYKRYLSYREKGELLKYFLYNSVVFISQKFRVEYGRNTSNFG